MASVMVGRAGGRNRYALIAVAISPSKADAAVAMGVAIDGAVDIAGQGDRLV